ncbi:type ISP restriction/modification enzyme [Pseudotabrizicola sp.]|uniref:type ISP restriction/modification enzyme n=1 Tax=Pseudotabrizicola sp. TaxID=2939647 RepID=UPI0027318037|nr:type ISP restriction/modification enzyme [Pseudotabrizicola sp.]MDP2081612.1 type ISP restriction/modification enzyme [Pseudotabrizicola sp.]
MAPDDQNDWINQRDVSFDAHISMGEKNGAVSPLFEVYSRGIETGRDAWCTNFSEIDLSRNIQKTVDFYNEQVAHFERIRTDGSSAKDLVRYTPEAISWTSSLFASLERGTQLAFESSDIRTGLYRPFEKRHVYLNKGLIHRMGKNFSIFPISGIENKIISVPNSGNITPFSALMANTFLDLFVTAAKGGTQCFPLHLYDHQDEGTGGLFADQTFGPQRRDGITDAGLKHFQDAYPGETITKEDLFYYVYGLLHSEDYRAKYADNLSKELPRIPRVKTAADFWAFSRAGRELGDLHVNYETVEPYPVTIKQGDLRLADIKNPEAFYRVTKWAFGKAGKEKDKTIVIYNANITMQDIPLEAYDYVVNGKPALEWVMERQVVKTDKDSGIENDANRYAIETMNNPAYPLELFQRVITVSLRTMEIVRGLPKLDVMA